MTFLNPAVLLGLVATAIPIVLHFINLRKIKKIEFSSLRFLKELKKNKIRNLKVKQWLLLFLRILLISFVVLAFSRPALKTEELFFAENAPKTVVVILDNSYSMFAGKSFSNFSEAKQLAIKILNQSKSYDKKYLILTSPFKTLKGKEIERKITKAEIGYGAGNLAKALSNAKKIIEKSKTLNKQIYLLSDFQVSNLSRKEIINFAENLRENISVTFILFRYHNTKNVAVEKINIANQILFPGKNVRFGIEIRNTNRTETESRTVSLFNNNEKTSQKNIKIPPDKKVTINLFSPIKSTGFAEIEVASEEDDIPFDNKRFAGFFVKPSVKILITSASKRSAKFLLAAFSKNVFKLAEVKYIKTTEILNSEINNFDILFAIGGINKQILDSFTKSGKTVVIFPDPDSNNDLINLFEKLGISELKEIKSSVGIEFDKIDFTESILKNIFENEKAVKIASPEIRKYFSIKPIKFCDKIITLENNLPFLCKYKYNNAEIFLFATPPDDSWSDFPFKPFFAPLLNRIAMLSASVGSEITELLVGDIYYPDLEKIPSPKIKIVTPDKNEYFLSIDFSTNLKRIKFNKTFLPGFYYVYSGNKLTDVFVVNVNTKESEMRFYSKNELQKITMRKIKIKVTEGDDSFISVTGGGSELWKLFLILSLFTAFAEMFVARTTKKDMEKLI